MSEQNTRLWSYEVVILIKMKERRFMINLEEKYLRLSTCQFVWMDPEMFLLYIVHTSSDKDIIKEGWICGRLQLVLIFFGSVTQG